MFYYWCNEAALRLPLSLPHDEINRIKSDASTDSSQFALRPAWAHTLERRGETYAGNGICAGSQD
jgi:hypothetical protein